jgi:hypothetical protein
VIYYNQNTGGVDKIDQMDLVERKTVNKGYMKLFRRLLNATVLNFSITGQKVDHNADW